MTMVAPQSDDQDPMMRTVGMVSGGRRRRHWLRDDPFWGVSPQTRLILIGFIPG